MLKFISVIFCWVFVLATVLPKPVLAIGLDVIPVGGKFAPGAFPPFGDGDVLTFATSLVCGLPTVVIIDPNGMPRVYQWGVTSYYLYWAQAYATNGWPYTHAGLNMVGSAIPSVNPLCPLPILNSLGDGLTKF